MSADSAVQKLVVTCPKGLEGLLVEEMTNLGAEQAGAGMAYAECEAKQELAYRLCLWSRLASRVLWPLAQFEGAGRQSRTARPMGRRSHPGPTL